MATAEILQGISFANNTGLRYQVLSDGNVIAEIERPADVTFQAQIPAVLSWADLRDERMSEVLAQIDPQYAFWSSILFLHPERTKRTLELINLVLLFCVFVEMRFKQAFGAYRPVEYNAQVQPMLTTPGHGSFPMGHATQAYAVVYVLKQLCQINPTKHPQPDRPARSPGGAHRD